MRLRACAQILYINIYKETTDDANIYIAAKINIIKQRSQESAPPAQNYRHRTISVQARGQKSLKWTGGIPDVYATLPHSNSSKHPALRCTLLRQAHTHTLTQNVHNASASVENLIKPQCHLKQSKHRLSW